MMIRQHQLRLVASAAAVMAISAPSKARAQASPLSESIVVGAWTFRPSLEVRIRGEYRRHPFDTGGDIYETPAVLYESPTSTLPEKRRTLPEVKNQYFLTERVRLGIAVDRGPVTGVVTLQDARVWGDSGAALVAPAEPGLPSFAPSEGYLDAHTRSGRKVFLRVGRQKVTWGDGRLLGANDWSPTGRSLDAARFGFQVGDFDFEMMAAMLATPGRYDKTVGHAAAATSGDPAGSNLAEGSGAQLYGLNVVWHLFPLLNIEATGFARVVRDPTPSTLTPGDTYVADGRISGDRRGFRYAIEGAYELGRIASWGNLRDLRAFAFAGRASWETALPGHLTFGAEGAYASGDQGDFKGVVRRFDPLLPDEHTVMSPMGLWAWSNVIEGGGTIGIRPIEELGFVAGYRYAALAQPNGRWSSASLVPIGASTTNGARALGHEIDGAFKITPWHALSIETGYGIFLRGVGADAILIAAGRPATLQHWAYLQTTVRIP
jgi:hypothetical protein